MTPSSVLDRLAYGAAVLFLPAAAGVLGGELGPSAGEPHIWDKAVHFTAYFVMSWLAVAALKSRATALWAMLGLIVMGGALEIIQGLIGRDCDIHDEIANSLGVLAGGLVAWIIVRLVARSARA
jgi:VanZ family protein